jgi:hypothetical protein
MVGEHGPAPAVDAEALRLGGRPQIENVQIRLSYNTRI